MVVNLLNQHLWLPELDSLKVWYPIRRGVLRRVVDYVKAVDDVNITIRAGETVGVVR